MNKTQLKQFATKARRDIEQAVRQKAYSFGITKESITPLQELEDGLIINGTVMGDRERKLYTHLKNKIALDGYEAVMSEAAYTWFNRFVALRYMEVNNFLPIGMRILSSEKEGKKEPDALTDVLLLTDELNLKKDHVYKLKEENQLNNLYQYLLIQQSNKLGDILPNVFEPISDAMALLLPDNLLNENSVIRDLVNMIDEESWKEVEIVGWLYQFYISEEKDDVFKNLKKNKKIGKKEIGPATQLFTPRWIVEYMVDNSLGRLWLESHPDEEIRSSLNYYLDDAEQEEAVLKQLENIKDPQLDIEQISFLDPSCGSGHILIYAFEVFHKIYLSRGFREREIPKLILENNLYGLDIDKRAAQLATFALVMKAREYDRRLFSRDYTVHVLSIEESNPIDDEQISLFSKNDEILLEETAKLINTFEDAKLYGSIIQVPEIDIAKIEQQIAYIREEANLDLMTTDLIEYSLPILEDLIAQYYLLVKKYDVVVTNPPYMGSKGMDAKIKKYLKKYYPDEKSDLFAVFMELTRNLTKEHGYIGTINQQSWMFLSSFEKLRNKLLKNQTIINMIHLGTRTFEEIGGEVVQNTAFILKNSVIPIFNASYIRMVDINSAREKQKNFANGELLYTAKQKNFSKIPGSPIAYWASKQIFKIFEKTSLKDISNVITGMTTGNNNIYLKLWFEINCDRISINESNMRNIDLTKKYWIPYSKGGSRRNWYGNNNYVVDWSKKNDFNRSKTTLQHLYLREAITWPFITSGKFSARYLHQGFLWDVSGSPGFFENKDSLLYSLGYLCTPIANYLLKLINPTINVQSMDIDNLPIIFNKKYEKQIIEIVKNNIFISKQEWDSFENSWDFEKHPFITYKETSSINDSFFKWKEVADERFYQLKDNEEELNRIFIDIYGLQDELTPEVEEKDVTVRKADLNRDVKSFLSYLVGVMFGRYSLDSKGLAYAGGDWDNSLYTSYQPDETNIIPLTEDQYFNDDIMNKVEDLLTVIYGEETLEENLTFIAEALTKKATESSRDRIRRYFMKEFYKDHLKIYQKRPIYWQFTSGKRGAFRGLMYLHRYHKYTIAQLRTDYVLHEAKVIDNLIQHESHVIRDESSTQAQKSRAQKLIDEYTKDRQELAQYDQVIDHVAKQQIDLDLDDGVKVNYEKFQNIEITDDSSSKTKTLNVFEKL
ncbi:BREX-1 system adenine-specific DNA-methyltransferase PglX [Alkalibacterium sp. s-m-22]